MKIHRLSLMLCQLRFSDSLNKDYDENITFARIVAGYGWFQEGKRLNASSVADRRCDLTNLEFGKYTNMSEKERQDYADAWLYIHRKKEK